MKRNELILNLNKLAKYPKDKEYKQNLYGHLVDMAWWEDTKITNDIERKNFLYQSFMEYYELINNGEVKEIEKDDTKSKDLRYWLLNLCKLQLDIELGRIERKDYTCAIE